MMSASALESPVRGIDDWEPESNDDLKYIRIMSLIMNAQCHSILLKEGITIIIWLIHRPFHLHVCKYFTHNYFIPLPIFKWNKIIACKIIVYKQEGLGTRLWLGLELSWIGQTINFSLRIKFSLPILEVLKLQDILTDIPVWRRLPHTEQRFGMTESISGDNVSGTLRVWQRISISGYPSRAHSGKWIRLSSH